VTVPTVQIPVPRGALFPLTVEELKVAVPRLDLLSDQLFNVADGTVLAASDPG
jgi:hypothetical protein